MGGSGAGTRGHATDSRGRDSPTDESSRKDRSSKLRGARDLSALFSQALRRLEKRTGCRIGCAWIRSSDGSLQVAAALSPRGAAIPTRDPAFAACVARGRAFDLGATDAIATRGSARRNDPIEGLRASGLFAAVPLSVGNDEPIALLLLGGGDRDTAGNVQPRTLAALEEEAARLSVQLSGGLAAARFEELDPRARRLDRLATLGELVAELVHEVRNPLVSVKTFLQLLPERMDDEEFTSEFRQIAHEEVERIERLLDTLARHAAPTESPSNPGAVACEADVDEVLGAIAALLFYRVRERSIELRLEIEERLPPIAIDPDSFRQLLLNLVLNAIDATDAKGEVVLRADLAVADGEVEISVDDGGPGIPVAQRERVFEPFHSTRRDRPGGLGLSIARRLAREAGGDLFAEEAPEGGARMRVRLPIATGWR